MIQAAPIVRPGQTEYPPYFHGYIQRVQQNDLLLALAESRDNFLNFLRSIPAQKFDYRYAEGKWNIKEIVSHIIDAERIFLYRALRFSRNDKTNLSGFDENVYVPESNAANRGIAEILEEYELVRNASIAFFKSITIEMSMRTGGANNREVSVRSLGYMIAGHEQHHQQVIKERYL